VSHVSVTITSRGSSRPNTTSEFVNISSYHFLGAASPGCP
jgi:hypothetical protein